MNNLPVVSIIIPTLNAEKYLKTCLDSIKKQIYPKSKLEIVIADGGSIDKTISIAKKFGAKIIFNSLKTAEAGKAVGVYRSTGKYIALIDSDNILPSKKWLIRMIKPLEKDQKLIGSEPISFTYRKNAGYIERYSALIGANDPYAFITGIYDRKNYLNNKWTGLKIETENFKDYLKIKLEPKTTIPTIGANGTIFRSNFLKQNIKSDYLFDIDIISQVLAKFKKPLYFSKVKISIIHTYCESSLSKFIRKQKRRITDFYQYQNLRQFNWSEVNKTGQIKFILYTVLIFPTFLQSFFGFFKKPDIAWFFHPIACLITLYMYAINVFLKKLNILKPIDRKKWKQ